MESVRLFNTELSGLYDASPPISKAKMNAITRSAMKAIKFYKHVVQSVEKFILKCKTEYKIPGLYVIDSIVRQSRHQFGAEKDVFAPRFARNMEQTFANLFRCPPEEKSKIIRVLNLWQKNNVFAPEVIQPIFDLANPDHPMHQLNMQNNQAEMSGNGMNLANDSPALQDDSSDMLNVNTSKLDSITIQKLQQFQQILIRQTSGEANNSSDKVKFNKKLLDFEYESDDEVDKSADTHMNPMQNMLPSNNNIASILNDPEVLKQLQTFQKLKQHEMETQMEKQTEMNLQEAAFERHLAGMVKKLPFAAECDLSRHPPPLQLDAAGQRNMGMFQGGLTMANINNLMASNALKQQQDQDVELVGETAGDVINIDINSRSPTPNRYKRRKSRSRSRDRRGRRRSKSRSRSRSPRSRRRNSSRDRTKDKERDKEREIEKERRRRGLPDIKKDHLSVCSTTLWVGHLSKLVQQEELSDTFSKFGEIVSIDMISPRGCAFIVMYRRQDAYKSMQQLKNHKMQGRIITISWAAGKGVKSKEWKDYWDLDLGVSYIPWSKLNKNTDFESLEEGGMFDDETQPAWMKDRLTIAAQAKNADPSNPAEMMMHPFFGIPAEMTGVDTSQPPPGGMMAAMSSVPPFPMGAMPRLMAPMGAMMPMAGLPLGVPPPQMMIPGMMPGMMAGPPPLDKSVPPPIASMMAFGLHAPPTITGMQPNHSDDHMDIEMEDEHATNKTDSVNFYSHPPPQLMGNASSSGNAPGSSSGGNDDFQRGDFRRRDRNRSSSRDKDFNKDFRRGGRSGDNERPQRGGEYRNRRDHSNEMEPRRGNRGEYQNDYNNGGNRRSQEIPSLLNVPLGQDDMPNRSNRNNDFSSGSRDDFDRRQFGGPQNRFNRGGGRDSSRSDAVRDGSRNEGMRDEGPRGRGQQPPFNNNQRGFQSRGGPRGGPGFQNNNFNDRQPFFDRNEFDDRSIGRNDRNDRGNRGRDNDRRSMNRHNEDRHEDRHAPNTQDRQGPTNNFRIDKKREGNSRWTNQKNDEQEEFPSDWDASAPEVESNTNKIFEDNGPPGFEEGFDESERLAAPAQDKSEDKSERNEHFEEKSSENVEMNDQRGEESSKAFERSENNDREMESEQREQREDIFEREERNERMDAPADDSFQESNQQHEQCHQDIFKDTPQHNEPEVAPHADDSQCGNTTPLCDELESKD